MRKLLLASVAVAALSSCGEPAWAYTVHDASCAVPAAPARFWYVDPVNGSTPDAAHGGVAVNGVMGTADGSRAHPFNSIQGMFQGGNAAVVPGYNWPIVASAPYDHAGRNAGFGVGVGAHAVRVDNDWNPAAPSATRANPGDEILLESGRYGDVVVGRYGAPMANVDASGATSFVTVKADAGATPVFTTLNVGGTQGIVFDGVTVQSEKLVGAQLSGSLVRFGGSAATPLKDVILANSLIQTWPSLAAVNAAWAAEDPAHTTYPTIQAFMKAEIRVGVTSVGDEITGAHANCISIDSNHIRWVYGGEGTVETSAVRVTGNEIDHFAADGIDWSASNFMSDHNKGHDAITIDAVHQDWHQSQVYGALVGPWVNVVLDHDVIVERIDPAAAALFGKIDFLMTTAQLVNARITNNIAVEGGCPGIAFSGTGSLIASNTVVGNGIFPTTGCPGPQTGEQLPLSDNNVWQNNAVAGRFYQACNHSIWVGNVQVPSRIGGVSTPGTLSYCKAGATAYASTAGSYNGITIYTTDSPTFAFQHYDPPAASVTSWMDPDLRPAIGGPLFQSGAAIPPNAGAM